MEKVQLGKASAPDQPNVVNIAGFCTYYTKHT